MNATLRTWWRRPAGGAEVLNVALPLVVSTSSWTLMYFIDRMFLLWYSNDSLAAALPASMLSFVSMCFFLGMSTYVNAFVSQYYGARRYQRIGPAVWQGVWLGLAASPLVLATIPLAPSFFEWVGHAPEVARQETIYYQILTVGAPPMIIAAALSSFFTGRGQVKTVMVVDFLNAMINVVLDYFWIFGYAGFPRAGIEGAGWATVVALWCRLAIYLALFLRPALRDTYQTVAGWRYDLELFRRLLRFGSPAGFHMLVEVVGFTAFLFLIGRLGPFELAATNLAINVNTLAFLPVFGIGIATTTLVGQHLGENRPELAARATWTAFWLAIGYTVVFGALYVLAPDLFLLGYKLDADPAQFGPLRDLTVILLRFVALYCISDTMNVIFASALKGAGDTRFIFITSLTLAALLTVFTWFGLEQLGLGIYYGWTVLMLWVVAIGTTFWLRFLQGRWRDMRVIEPEALAGIETHRSFDDDADPEPERALVTP